MESDDLLDFIPLEGLVDHNFSRLLVHSILDALQRRNIRTFRFLENVLVLHDNSRNGILVNSGNLVDTPPAESQQYELEKLRNLITHDFDGHCATQIFQPQSKKEFEDYVKSAVFSLDTSLYVLLREISLKTLGSNITDGHGSNHDSDKLDFNWSTVFLRGDDDSCRQEQFNRLCSFFKAVKSESEPEYHAPYNVDNNDLMTTAKTVIAQMDIEDLCHKIYFVLQLLTNYRRTTSQGKSTIVSGAINRFDFSLNESMAIYDCQVKSELIDLFNHFDLNTRKEAESAFGTTYNNMVDNEIYPLADNSGEYYGVEPGSPTQPAASHSVVFSEFSIFYALVRELSSIHIKFAQDFGLFSNSEFSFDILKARHFGESNESQTRVSGNDDFENADDHAIRPNSALGKFLENLQYMLLNENEIRSVIMVLSSILHLTNLEVEFVTAFEFQKMTGKIEVNDNGYSGYNAYYKNKMKAMQKNRSSSASNNTRFDYNSYLRSSNSNNSNNNNNNNNSETMGFDNSVKNIPFISSKTFSVKQIALNLGISEDSLYAHVIFGDSQSTANIGTASNANGNNQKKSNDVFDFSQFFQDQNLYGSPDNSKRRSKWGSQTSVDVSNAKTKEEIFRNISNLCRALYHRVFSFIVQKMNELFETRFSFKYLNPNYGNGLIAKPKLSQCLTVFDVCGSRDFFSHNKNVSTLASISQLGYKNTSTFVIENTLAELFVNFYNEKLNFHSMLQKDELFVANNEQEYLSFADELNHFQYVDSLANIDNLFRTIENASNLSSISRDISNSFMFVYLENNIRMANNQHSQFYESQFSHLTQSGPADETSSQVGFKGKNGVLHNANTIRLFDNNHFIVSHFSNQIVYCSQDIIGDNNAMNQIMGNLASSHIDSLFSNCFEPNLKTLIQSTSIINGEENMGAENHSGMKKTYLTQGRALLSEFLKENDELLDEMEVHSVLNVNLFDTDEVTTPIDLLASQNISNMFNKNKGKKLLTNDYLMKQLNNFQIIAKLKSFHLKSFPYKFFLRDLHSRLKPFLMDFGIDFINCDEDNNQIQHSDEMVHAQTSFVISRIVSDFNEELRQSQMHILEAQNKLVETKENGHISKSDHNNNKFDDKAKYNRSNSNGITSRKREMSQSSLTTITNSNANNSAENQFEGSQSGPLVDGNPESNQSMDERNNRSQEKNDMAQIDEHAISYKPLDYKISKHLIHCNFDLMSILNSAVEILHNRLATKIQSSYRAHYKSVDFNRLKKAVIRVQSNFRRRMWFRLYKSVMNLDVELSKNESQDIGNSSYLRGLMKDRQYSTVDNQQKHFHNTASTDTGDSGHAYIDMHRKYSSVLVLRRAIPKLLRELSFRHELLTLHAFVADGNIEDIQKFYCDMGPGGLGGNSIASRTEGSHDAGRAETDDQSVAVNTVRSDRELPYFFDNPYINGIKRVRNSRDFMRNAFHVAAINSQAEVFVRLRPNVDDILCKDSSGNLPLHLTYLNPRTDLVRRMFISLQSTCPPIFRMLTDPDYYGYCGKEGDPNVLNTGKVKSRTVDYFKHHLHAVVANTVMSNAASASNTSFDTSIIRTDMVFKLNRFKQFQKRLFVLSKSTNVLSRGNSSVEGPNILSCTLRYYKPSVNMALNLFEDEFQLNTFNCELFGIELDHNALNFGKGFIIIIRMRNDDNKNNDVSDVMHEIYLETGFYENATKTSTYNFKSTNGRNQIIFACETREAFHSWLRNLCDHGLQLTHLTPAIIHQGIFRPQIHSVHDYDDKQSALQRSRREDTIDYSSVAMTDFYAMKLFFSTPNQGGRTLLHLLAFCETFISERPDDIFLDDIIDTNIHGTSGGENEVKNESEANVEYDMDEIINIIESENANMIRNNETSPTRKREIASKKQQYSQEIFVHNPDDESNLSPTFNNKITKFPYVKNDFFNSIDFDLTQVTSMISCACYLIENGCSMDNYDLERKTVLDYALAEGNFFLIAFLVLRGCDTVYSTGTTALSLFSSVGKKASFMKSIRKSQAATRYNELLAAYKKPKLQHFLNFRPTEDKIPGGTYFSLYLGRIILTSSSMLSFTSLQCPFIRIRVQSIDQVVIDEVISPYPCAFHGADLLLIGLRFDLKAPMESLPNKFMIEFQVKDYNTKKKMEVTVLKGIMNVNQFRVQIDDMKVVDMKSSGGSEVAAHFVMEPFLSRHEPPPVANSIFDYVDSCHLSYNSFIRSLERNPRLGQGYRRHARSHQSNDDESVVSSRYKQSQEVANNFRWNFRPSWFSCDSLVNMYEVRCDNIMKSDFLVDVVVTLGAEVVPGTKVVSVGGLQGISFIIPRGLLPHQRIVVKVPLRLLLEKRIETLSEDKV